MAKINKEAEKHSATDRKVTSFRKKSTKKIQKVIHVSEDTLPGFWYKYDEETRTLSVYDGNKRVWKGRAEKSAVYAVYYDGVTYSVSKRNLPHRKNDLLMWLFGFTKSLRFDNDEQFQNCLERHREKHKVSDYKEYIYSGPGFAFGIYTKGDNPTPKRICAWVDPKVDRRLAKRILSIKELNIAAMQEFYGGAEGQLLIDYFGFRLDDFDEVNRKLLSRK